MRSGLFAISGEGHPIPRKDTKKSCKTGLALEEY